jgi:hypothetical protein
VIYTSALFIVLGANPTKLKVFRVILILLWAIDNIAPVGALRSLFYAVDYHCDIARREGYLLLMAIIYGIGSTTVSEYLTTIIYLRACTIVDDDLIGS